MITIESTSDQQQESIYTVSKDQCSKKLFKELRSGCVNFFLGARFAEKTINLIKMYKRGRENGYNTVFIRFSPTSSKGKLVSITSNPNLVTGKIYSCPGYLCKSVIEAEAIISSNNTRGVKNLIIFDKCALLDTTSESISLCLYLKRLMKTKGFIIASQDEKNEYGDDCTMFNKLFKNNKNKIFSLKKDEAIKQGMV